jgi:hypothetical protein
MQLHNFPFHDYPHQEKQSTVPPPRAHIVLPHLSSHKASTLYILPKIQVKFTLEHATKAESVSTRTALLFL